MVNYLELPVGERAPEVFRVVIEIPLDGTQKFEYDKQLHVFKLDRNLHSPVHYPGDYGFIPSTLSDDGDPLDVLVLVPGPSFPGCVQEVRPIGLLEMLDQGILDEKVPYNPLHDQGYPSIGCWPCTRPVTPGKDERAGRWTGRAKTECGLHT